MMWMLFAGDNYYPSGGMNDYQGSHATLGACMVAYYTSDRDFDWGHAVRMNADGTVGEKSESSSWPKAMNERDYGDVDES